VNTRAIKTAPAVDEHDARRERADEQCSSLRFAPAPDAVKRGLFFAQPAVVFNIFNRVFNSLSAAAARSETLFSGVRFLTFYSTVENYFSHFQPRNKMILFTPLIRWKIMEYTIGA
jgi:hypothetical protein